MNVIVNSSYVVQKTPSGSERYDGNAVQTVRGNVYSVHGIRSPECERECGGKSCGVMLGLIIAVCGVGHK